LAETINGLYKAEVIHRRGPWRSLEAVEFATLEWRKPAKKVPTMRSIGGGQSEGDWLNNRRLLHLIGNIPPAEAEANFYARLEALPIAA
jgi:transposase InsO family protein